MVSCIVGSISMDKLMLSYDKNCILDAKLSFKLKPSEQISETIESNETMMSNRRMFTLGEFFTHNTLFAEDQREIPIEQLKYMNECETLAGVTSISKKTSFI